MRADRLFDVIQVLRSAKKPVTAAVLADELEVTVRTIYRDVATLQARRVPIEGAPGVGCVLRQGFDLPLRSHVADAPFYVSRGDAVTPKGVDVAQVRSAIRDRRKIRISYVDEKNKRTRRTIWPLAMAYYVDVTLIGAWCELRKDFRNFRVERIAASRVLAQRFQDHNGQKLAEWLALPKDRPVTVL